MNQRELNREIAKATGETITEISNRGFVLLTGQPYERDPQTIDWDDLEAKRNLTVTPRRTRTPVVV